MFSNYISGLLCSLFAVSCLSLPPVAAIQPINVKDSASVKGIKIIQPAEYNKIDGLVSEEGIISKIDWEGIVDFEETGDVVVSIAPTVAETINYIQSFAAAPLVYAPKDFAPVDPIGDRYAKWLETAWIDTTISTNMDNSVTTTIQNDIDFEFNPPITVVTSTAINTLHLVINAISIGTASSTLDEFIEIYNPTSAVINLAGWKLKRVTASGQTENYLVRPFPAGAIVNSRGHFLIAHHNGYSITTPDRMLPDMVYTTGSSIASSNTIILFNASSEIVDMVGYGEVTQFEGAPAEELLNDGQVLARTDGVDTDNNGVDFILRNF